MATATDRRALAEWVDRWTGHALNTSAGEDDHDRFTAAARTLYDGVGMVWPGAVTWVASPHAMLAAAATLTALLPHDASSPTAPHALGPRIQGACLNAEDGIRIGLDAVTSEVITRALVTSAHHELSRTVAGALGLGPRGPLPHRLIAEINDTIRKALLTASPADAVRGEWGPTLRNVNAASLREALGAHLPAQLWQVTPRQWGPAGTSFAREVLGRRGDPDEERILAAAEVVAQTAFAWFPHTDFVLACRRPISINPVARPRLRNAHTTAIAFGDGAGVWAIGSDLVDPLVLEVPDRITAADIIDETDAQTRLWMLERYTLARLIQATRPTVVDAVHEPPFVGLLDATLYQLALAGEVLTAIRVINTAPEPDGSHTPIFLRVHPQLRPLQTNAETGVRELGPRQSLTCRNAIASTFGLTGEQYAPEVET